MFVIAAVFPDRTSAAEARDQLGKDEHFTYRWLAETKPADHPDATVVPEPHEIASSTDGGVGALGRFLSGAGGSLRRALHDHGVEKGDAEAMDEAVGDHGAVLVVHARDELRAEHAEAIMTAHGGRLYPDVAATAPYGATTVATPTTSGATAPVATAAAGTAAAAGTIAAGETTAGATGAAHETTPGDYVGATNAVNPAAERSGDGEMVVRRRTFTEMQTLEVPVTREEVYLERRRPTDTADGT